MRVRRSDSGGERLAAQTMIAELKAIQTDVIGDPWVAYVVWGLAGLTIATYAPFRTIASSREGHGEGAA